MASDQTPFDISRIPAIAEIAADVRRTKTPRLLTDGEAEPVILMLLPSKPRRRKTGVLRANDPLFGLIGIGRSGIPGGISGKKHEALGRLRHT